MFDTIKKIFSRPTVDFEAVVKAHDVGSVRVSVLETMLVEVLSETLVKDVGFKEEAASWFTQWFIGEMRKSGFRPVFVGIREEPSEEFSGNSMTF